MGTLLAGRRRAGQPVRRGAPPPSPEISMPMARSDLAGARVRASPGGTTPTDATDFRTPPRMGGWPQLDSATEADTEVDTDNEGSFSGGDMFGPGGVPNTRPRRARSAAMTFDSGRGLMPASSPSDRVMVPIAGSATAEAAAERHGTFKERRRLAIILVGLPARGKTFVSAKLSKYLRWLGHDTKHFNVGKYRRRFHGCAQPAEFYDPTNSSAVEAREQVARMALLDMLQWMEAGGQVGIFDATNSTRARRQMLLDLCEGKCKVIFLETICCDRAQIIHNVREKVRRSPDYANRNDLHEGPGALDFEAGVEDFMCRIENYESCYEPVGGGTFSVHKLHPNSYVKIIDNGWGEGQVQVNRITGYLPARIVFFLINSHMKPRPVFLTRHGESEFNAHGRIGGDTGLTRRGRKYSRLLGEFISSKLGEDPCSVWTSTLRRATSTARHLQDYPQVQWRALDEIDAGVCDGMTYLEIKETMRSEWTARERDKLRYRYPRGESYLDVIQRLEPVLIELERQRAPVVVVAHQAVLRALYAYFLDRPLEDIPHLEVPLHTVIELTPHQYGVQDTWHKLPVDATGPSGH